MSREEEVMDEPTVWAKAKDVLWERGWQQDGRALSPNGVCVYGAVAIASGQRYPIPTGEHIRVLNVIAMERGAPGIGTWNDTSGRTFDDVLDLLDELDKAERETSA